MPKPDFAKMGEEAARAFAGDAYRQLSEMTEARDQLHTDMSVLKTGKVLVERERNELKLECERLRVTLTGVIDMCAPVDGEPDTRASIVKARAAIAKSKGVTP